MNKENKKRTGLKILFWKIQKHIKYPYRYFDHKPLKFPKYGQPKLLTSLWLKTVVNETKDWKMQKTLGFLYNKPNGVALDTWNKLLSLNSNNLGEWGTKDIRSLSGTQKSEWELIHKMIDLYGGKDGEWTGYSTSGATESNIFSVWMGRNFLSSKKRKTALILNQFTHYSIYKAANVTNIPVYEIPVDRTTWKPSLPVLEAEITRIIKKGYTGFLIPITLGYTQTGINDDYLEIIKMTVMLQKKYGIIIFTWIDAAINGLVLPFTTNSFRPLHSHIYSICLDFHKTGMCPIPSGLVLYKKSLVKHVEQNIAYLDQNDNTLLGSRPGVAPAAMLALINSLGKEGFKKNIQRQMTKKKIFIAEIKSQNIKVEIINENEGTGLALVSDKQLPEKLVRKYGLFAKRWKYPFLQKPEYLYIYKVNFLN